MRLAGVPGYESAGGDFSDSFIMKKYAESLTPSFIPDGRTYARDLNPVINVEANFESDKIVAKLDRLIQLQGTRPSLMDELKAARYARS